MNIKEEVFRNIVEPFLRPRIKKGSIQAVKGYVTAVKFGRYAVMGLFGLGAFAALFVVGLFMAIIGAIGLLPVEAETVALTTLIIGLVLFVGAGIGALLLFNQRRWLTMSKSYEMMDAVLSPWPSMMPPNPKDVMNGYGPKGELDFATRRVEREHIQTQPPVPTAYVSPEVPTTMPPVDAPANVVPQMMH
ncbi:MAG: phage holin family protein [Bdellovibrionota bacterium]